MARMPDGWIITAESDGLNVRLKESRELVMCKSCKYADTFSDAENTDFPLKCLGIRYGGVQPNWYCEHGERKNGE